MPKVFPSHPPVTKVTAPVSERRFYPSREPVQLKKFRKGWLTRRRPQA